MVYKIGSKVIWKWLGREIHGRVIEIYFKPVTKVIKGKSIKRKGSKECPAYLVEAESGNLALKLQTELFARLSTQAQQNKPKIFTPE